MKFPRKPNLINKSERSKLSSYISGNKKFKNFKNFAWKILPGIFFPFCIEQNSNYLLGFTIFYKKN